MTDPDRKTEERIAKLMEAVERLRRSDFPLDVPPVPNEDELEHAVRALTSLAQKLENQCRELQELDRISSRIAAGMTLEEVADNVYEGSRELIPYNRIGLALFEDEGRTLRARWARTDLPEIHLEVGYSASMEGSSLEQVLATGQPRILNDLGAYLREKPDSESTQLVYKEGIRSSLTCPLIADGVPIGFLFFSSVETNMYAQAHVDVYQRIARHLAISVEKGRLMSDLASRKAELERRNEELLRLNDLKNSFLGMAAHDLRNPIANISMITGLLMDERMPWSKEERTGFLRDIKGQTEQMLALLNDLLDVSRIEAGKVDIHVEPVRIREILEDKIRRHAMLAEAKQTRVVSGAIPDCLVEADPLRLGQVMDNLLSNAVKFSPPGSLVTVTTRRKEDDIRVEIHDQGPGIMESDRRKLFQDFASLSARPTGGESSTGLGLAIAKRVVEAHRGRIGVDSDPGHGAVFWFTLRCTEEGGALPPSTGGDVHRRIG